ncbi:hypothetical protein, conserved [Leishmania donovani]|uniref:Primase C terminal 2 (PriCT-2) family protein n=2 Tax=Leishmania donovani TaxID=5661 RepID=E9BGA4_LEIDO|nr:hypothetical protein, conserved [Leishmania donovani]TPP50274.1 Primase C terminal 2 (PriCT-2) family protein [Leishmania donovani]CBZ34280.1 hypothetical protein, conserved [Leishmania donovani]
MQRLTSARLFKGAFNAGQKRTTNASAGAAAAASRPQALPQPHQASTMTPPAAKAAAAAPQASLTRSASLVAPPSASVPPSGAAAGAAPPMRKKKIIRRIIKRKKASAGAATVETVHHAAAEAVSQPAAPAAPSEPAFAAATGAQPPRRGLAMLNEIRKHPEGSIEEKPHVITEQHSEETATPQKQYHEHTHDHHVESQETEKAHEHHHHHDAVSEKATSSRYKASSAEAETDAAARSDDMYDAIYNNGSSSSRKTAMVKGYRIDEVGALCSSSDAMFARRLPSGGCQFFAWPGTPLPVASSAIVSMPDTIRTVHAVFGRAGTPIDIVMDIDAQVPQEYWTMSKIRVYQRKVLDDVLTPLKEEIEKIGEEIETQVVLQSPNLKKASFHVHTRLKDAAFADFYSLHGFLFRFQDRLPNVDLQIYRPNGMLRMFSCMKENRTSAIIVFDEPKWNIGFPGGKVSDEQAALHSICVRDPSTFSRVLTFEAPRQHNMPAYGGSKGACGDGNEGALRPPQVLLPRTEKEAIENASRWLRQATEVEVGEWRTWIGLGLCAYRVAYQFRNARNLPRPAMAEMLDAWTEASRKCPLKFHSGECEARWAAFDPEKLGSYSDWWSAYKRLGRLEVPMREAMEREAAFAARCASRYQAAPAAEVPLAPEPPQFAAAAGSVTSASRKMKQQKKAFRRA